jgi:hypothetical protein
MESHLLLLHNNATHVHVMKVAYIDLVHEVSHLFIVNKTHPLCVVGWLMIELCIVWIHKDDQISIITVASFASRIKNDIKFM